MCGQGEFIRLILARPLRQDTTWQRPLDDDRYISFTFFPKLNTVHSGDGQPYISLLSRVSKQSTAPCMHPLAPQEIRLPPAGPAGVRTREAHCHQAAAPHTRGSGAGVPHAAGGLPAARGAPGLGLGPAPREGAAPVASHVRVITGRASPSDHRSCDH